MDGRRGHDETVVQGAAVEVALTLGDSVVGVRHVMNPKGGKVTLATCALFATAAALLLMSAFAFIAGVRNAARNADSKRDFINKVEDGELLAETIHDWRPHRISLGLDWMALGGAVGGLIALTLGMLRVRDERDEPYCRIGRGANVHFPLDSDAGESFPLVAPLDDRFVFNFWQGMDGEMIADGQSTRLAELVGQGRARPSSTTPGAVEAPISNEARFRIRLGKSTFLISSVNEPRRQAVPLFAAMDASLLRFVGGSAAAIIGFLALVLSIPPDPKTLGLDLNPSEARLARVESRALEDPKGEQPQSNGDQGHSGGGGAKMALVAGKMGRKESTRRSGLYVTKNHHVSPQLARKQAMKAASNAGFLGALNRQQGGAFASLTGTGDFSSGQGDRDVYGGLQGHDLGEMAGGFGFGVSGVGPGGDGAGWGTIGAGAYGTIGHATGTGSGYSFGPGGGMHSRHAHHIRVVGCGVGCLVKSGELDKDIIRRYIRRQLPRITACYEKELLVKPSLRGTVVTQFQISPMGGVISATASGIGDRNVETCVAAAIKAIQFPKPRGGGLVNVRYPFTFRPAR